MPPQEKTPLVVSRSPQNPSDVVARSPALNPEAVQKAAARAGQAFREWSRTPALERANRLEAVADALSSAAEEFVDLMVREVGKPRLEAAAEVERGIAILRYFGQQALDPVGDLLPATPGHALLYTRRRPRGIAGLITPWNFPVAIPLWKAAPALAFGNTVLLKPAPDSTGIALRLGEIFEKIMPPEVLTVISGGGRTGRAVLEVVDVISFTGSVPVGREVSALAVERGIPFQAEMGGLNASIVLPDSDVERASTTIARAAMGYAGQKCTATSRAIVVGDSRRFTDALVSAVQRLGVGDPASDDTALGPVITETARDRVIESAGEARRVGGRVLVGGEALDVPGWFIAPTLVDGLPREARVLQEEVFGPICAVIDVEDIDEAVSVSNSVPYGLVTSVFTSELDHALRLVDQLDTGLIRVNAPTSGVDFYAPFGGQKASGAGPREQGKVARDFYTSLHTITLTPGA